MELCLLYGQRTWVWPSLSVYLATSPLRVSCGSPHVVVLIVSVYSVVSTATAAPPISSSPAMPTPDTTSSDGTLATPTATTDDGGQSSGLSQCAHHDACPVTMLTSCNVQCTSLQHSLFPSPRQTC